MSNTDTPPVSPVSADDPPRTLSALNAKVDLITSNGEVIVTELRRLIGANIRRRRVNAILAGVALVLSLTSINASREAHHTAVQVCESGNRQDLKQRKLWEFIISLTAGNPSTLPVEVQRQQTAAFRAYLADAYRPQEC